MCFHYHHHHHRGGLYGLVRAYRILTGTPTQSVTPFPPSSSQQGAGQQIEVPGTPWWLPNAADPSTIPQVGFYSSGDSVAASQADVHVSQMPPLHSEFNLETLGLNLNELWGSGTFDWDAMMP
jgi:hypothetical protein